MSFRLLSKTISAIFLFAFCFIGLDLQMPRVAAQSGGAFSIRADVELVTVEVTALDKQGKPLRNLKKEEFRLYEDGKKQEIISFDEVNGESAISPSSLPLLEETGNHRGKTVLIVFNRMRSVYTQASRDSAERYVKKHMQQQDLFAVASCTPVMRILQSFTGDRELVLAAIHKADDLGFGNYADMLHSLQKINYSMARLKGRKTVLIYDQSDLMFGKPTMDWEDKCRSVINSAKKSNVVYYTIDPSSVDGEHIGGFSARSKNPGLVAEVNVRSFNLSSIAAGSGGFSIYNTNNYDAELDKLDRQISNYYILGFQSNNPKHDGSFRKLEVRTELKGVSLKYREGYLDRRPIDVLESSRQEKTLMTALASPVAAGQLPIVFRPAYFYDSSPKAKVLVEARISTTNMAFKKRGAEFAADINVMGVAYAEDGSVAARFSQTIPMSFNKENEAAFRNNNYVYRNYLKLRPGKYQIKLAVSDDSNNLGAAEQSLEIPPLLEKGLTGSSIILIEQTSKLPELVQNLEANLLDGSDPLPYSGMEVQPRAENNLTVNSAIQVLFRLYNLSGPSDRWNLVAKPELLNEKGDAIALDPISLKSIISPVAGAQGVVALNLPFQGVSPGKYKLIIEVADATSAETATVQTDIEYVN